MRWGVSITAKRSVLKEKAEALDAVFAEIDPIMVAGATAAGVAGACGMKGPMTTILAGLQGDSNVTIPGFIFEVGTLGVIPTVVGNLLTGKSLSGDTGAATPNQLLNVGYAMSNVCEFMIVYALATNPGTPAAAAKIIESLGPNLKVLGAMLK